MRRLIAAVLVFTLINAALLIAQAPPELINLQGRLTDASGNAITANTDMRFDVYDASSGGNLLLTDEHASGSAVTVTDGHYNVLLGGGTLTTGTESDLAAVFENNSGVYVEIYVHNGTAYEMLSPRVQLVSSAYALNAAVSQNSALLEGQPGSHYKQDLADVVGQGADAGGAAITNLLDPSNAQDAATKNYVDSQATTLTTQVTTNTTNISTNSGNITANSTAISTLQSTVSANGVSISSNSSNISTLQGTVSSNTSSTSSNTSDIGTLQSSLAAHTANSAAHHALTLAASATDVSTTEAEIDQALDGISANVTAANLNTLTGGTSTTLHAHPSGSGSGADADTLDTIDSASFLRSDTNDSFTGTQLTATGDVIVLGDTFAGDDTADVLSVAGRIGIGTTTPNRYLDITFTTGTGHQGIGLRNAGGTGGEQAWFVDVADTTGNAGVANGVPADGFGIIDATANATRFVIDATGNVGIGTNSPSSALDVNGTATASAFVGDGSGLTNVAAGTATDTDTLDTLDSTQFLRSDASDSFTSGTLSTGGGTIFNVGGTFQIGGATMSTSAADLNQLSGIGANVTAANLDALTGGGATALHSHSGSDADTLDTLDSTDFLRGTANSTLAAANTLDIAGIIDVTGTLNIGGVTVDSTAAELNALNGISGNVTATNLNTLTGASNADSLHSHTLTTAGGWIDTGTDVALATSTDNVGIGIGSPSQKLHVVTNDTGGQGLIGAFLNQSTTTNSFASVALAADNGTVAAQLQVDGLGTGALGTAGVYVGAVTNHPVGIFTGNTERVRIDTAGNVGIGVTTTQSLLHVDGAVPEITLRDSTANRLFALRSDASGNFILRDNTALASRLVISPTGNVGIGAGSPSSAKLTVLETGTNVGLIVDHQGASGDIALFRDGGTTEVVIDGTGQMGIGNAVPTADLHIGANSLVLADGTDDLKVTDDIELDGAVLGATGSVSAPTYSFSNDPDTGMYRQSFDNISFATGGVRHLSILNNGHISFGDIGLASSLVSMNKDDTTSNNVSTVLQLRHSNSAGFGANGIGTGFLFLNENSAGTNVGTARIDAVLQTATAGSEVPVLLFKTGSGMPERMRIDGSTGNVGISTTTPRSTLDVGGSFGLSVTSLGGGAFFPGDAASMILMNGAVSPSNITLPAASTRSGRIIFVKSKDSTNTVNMGTGGGNIDGNSSLRLATNEGVMLVSDGADWWTVNRPGGTPFFMGSAPGFPAGTTYVSPAGNQPTEADIQIPAPRDGIVRNLTVFCSTNSTTGPITVAFRLNATGTALTTTIPATSNGVYTNTTNQIGVSAGDLMSVQLSGGVSGLASIRVMVEYQ